MLSGKLNILFLLLQLLIYPGHLNYQLGVDHYQLVVEVLVVAEQLIVKLPRKTVAVDVVVTVAVVDDVSQQIQYAIQPEVHFKI